MNTATIFEVRRDELPTYRWTGVPRPSPSTLRTGDVLLAVEKFAFTSNNVTYAAYGDRLQYWDFFPAETGWGRIPVWAYLRAIDSRADGIAAGERFYGYAPMASHLLVQADHVSPRGFVDAAPHRQPMPAVYSRYSRVAGVADEGSEALEMLLRPLFLTSFLLYEFLKQEHYFGASRIVISSASSKTAYGTAFLLADAQTPDVIGLTSTGNLPFVKRLGCYAQVLPYEDLERLPADDATVYVDFSGGRDRLSRVHHHFRQLRHSCTAGGTQWDQLDDGTPLPGPKPEIFFAAPHMARGGAGLQERMAHSWRRFCAQVLNPARPWMQIIHENGCAAVEGLYPKMLEGHLPADHGYLLSIE